MQAEITIYAHTGAKGTASEVSWPRIPRNNPSQPKPAPLDPECNELTMRPLRLLPQKKKVSHEVSISFTL